MAHDVPDYGNTAHFSGGATQPAAAIDWETDYAASPAVAKKGTFEVKEGHTPKTVAQNLAAAFNRCNAPNFSAKATDDKVVFTASDLAYKVSDMRFIINSQTENLPASGASVAVGNTGLSVNNTNTNS